MYKISFHEKAIKDLKKVSKKDLVLIKNNIKIKLSDDPTLFGKPLRRSLKNYRVLRFGKYRIVHKISGKNVKILAIGHRQDIYEEAMNRL
jgi:mRNA interferase RelE/StbE